jgi:hypothetical protein
MRGGAGCGYLRQGVAVGAFDGVAEAAHSMSRVRRERYALGWGSDFAEFVFEHGSVCGFIVVGVTINEWGHPVYLQSCEWCEIVRECIE